MSEFDGEIPFWLDIIQYPENNLDIRLHDERVEAKLEWNSEPNGDDWANVVLYNDNITLELPFNNGYPDIIDFAEWILEEYEQDGDGVRE